MGMRWGQSADGRPVLLGNPRAVFIPPDGSRADPKYHDFLPCDLDPPCTDPEVCHLEMDLPVMCRSERAEHATPPGSVSPGA